MDPDPDPAIFVIDLKDKDLVFAYYFLEVQLHHFSEIKSHKTVGLPDDRRIRIRTSD
jgi:hypothetical protein